MKTMYACPGCEQRDNKIKALEANIKQLERLYEGMSVIAKTLEGEVEILENLAKLSGATDPYSKRIK